MVLNHDDLKHHGIIPVWVAQKLHVTEGAGAEGLTLEYQCLEQAVERYHLNCGNEGRKH